MASYNELLALIDAYINRNGVQAITGQILNGVLKAMVDQLGRGYPLMGYAEPTGDPGTPDGPESWFASVPGTYTNYGEIQVAAGELALLSFAPSEGWTKNTIYEGFREVTATADDNIGFPQVGVTYANGVLSFDFKNIKGEPGENGQDGDPAGFGAVTASVDDQVGTPSVSVSSSGPDTAKVFSFAFHNLKGETGVTSVVATVDNTSGNPQCSVSLQGGQLTLAFTGLKGAQGDTGSSVDYPFTIVNNLTTNDPTQALSAAMGVQLESEVSQLEAEVYGVHFDSSFQGTGAKKNLSIPLLTGDKIVAFDGPMDYFTLFIDSSDTTGTKIYKANLPFVCVSGYARGQAYQSGFSGTVTLSVDRAEGTIDELSQDVSDVDSDLAKTKTLIGYAITPQENISLSPTIINDLWIATSQVIERTTGRYLYYIRVFAGQTIVGNWEVASGSINEGFTDKLPGVGVAVSNYGTHTSSWKSKTITASADCYYCVCFQTTPTSISFSLQNTGIGKNVKILENAVFNLDTYVNFLKNVARLSGKTVDYAGKVANAYINSSGAFVTSQNFDAFVLKADEARTVIVKTGGNSGEGALGVSFFGKDVTESGFISGIQLQQGEVTQNVTIPSGTGYIVVSNRRSVLATPEIYLTTGDPRPFVVGTEVTEIGNISINASGWSYTTDAERARTLYNCTLHLNPGDTIVCTGTTVVFVGGKLKDGTFVTSGNWVTFYPIRKEGDYVFVSRFSTEVAPTDGDKKYITDDIKIYTENANEIRAFFASINSPLNDWDKTIRAINHRGYNKMAPENTLPAFKLSKANGFGWVETDIRLTSDNEIVCIHDATVDRTSSGTGNVADMTLAQLKALDFGSWFSPTYEGVTIPTLGEFLRLCKCIGLCAYIELKYPLDATKATQIVETVRKYGMMGRVNYISYMANLRTIASVDNKTRLGWIGTPTQTDIDDLLAIAEDYGNDVFVDMSDNTDEKINLCAENGVDVEYWTGNANWILNTMKNGFWGVTSDESVAGKYLYLDQRQGAVSH